MSSLKSASGLTRPHGRRFGKLKTTAQTRIEIRSNRKRVFRLCICDCGKQTWVRQDYLIGGDTRSCGCAPSAPAHRFQKKTYGKFYVLGEAPKKRIAQRMVYFWNTQCLCGANVVLSSEQLLSRPRLGCDACDVPLEQQQEHLHKVWQRLRRRCYDPNNSHFVANQGAGIGMDATWRTSYAAFRDWAHSVHYHRGGVFMRIDEAKDFAPQNASFHYPLCAQELAMAQTVVTAFGETKTLGEWLSDPRCGVNRLQTLFARLRRKLPAEVIIASYPLPTGPDKRAIAVGTRFDHWEVTGAPHRRFMGKQRQPRYYYPCRCDCGRETFVNAGSLYNGVSHSCGCHGLKTTEISASDKN